jgi:RNA polymerase sigma factor (sigma-70 family)
MMLAMRSRRSNMKFLTLTQDELSVLADAVRLGLRKKATGEQRLAADQARTVLMEAYAPLVVRLSDKYAARLGRQEALSAGFYGCALALNSWNPDKGALPSWIRLYCKSALIREVDKLQHIRLPQDTMAKRAKIQQLRGQLIEVNDIAKQVGMTATDVVALEKTPRVVGVIDDLYQVTVDDATESAHSEHYASQLLDSLDALGKFVLSARFGIGYGGVIHSYEELSKLMGLSINEIATVEATALGRLRQEVQPV